ncbi:MAG: VWA domain-containing protein [Chloroflexi bacterium]|nr:VWA domain-containing protein [Chloroflexota bacterium]
MTGLVFAQPLFLWLLPLLAVALLWRWLWARPRSPAAHFSSLTLTAVLPETRRQRWLPLPAWLRSCALVLLLVALARPQLGQGAEETPLQGLDIVLALDTSYSMKETDFGGRQRAEVAKQAIKEFVQGRQDDRIGLVLFSGISVVQSPLTVDYAALLAQVEPLESGVLAGGTAIGLGLAEALNLLRDSRARSKVVILLSDGENNSGDISPPDAARMARALQVRVYTIGAEGGPPEPVGRPGGRGRTTTSGLDEGALRVIAETSGGAYYRASDERSLREIYRQIGELERSYVGGRRFHTLHELAPSLLPAGLLLLIAELLLGQTVLRRAP